MAKKQTSGIYKIKNTVTGKVYIGQSKNIEKRFEQHKEKFRNGTHINDELQKDFNKGHRFVYEIVEETRNSDRDTLDKKEEYYIKKYDSKRNGYNMTWGGRTDKYASESYRNQINNKKPTNHSNAQKISEGTFQSRIERKIYETQTGIKLPQLSKDPVLREKQMELAKRFHNESKYLNPIPKATIPKATSAKKPKNSRKVVKTRKPKKSMKIKTETFQERIQREIRKTNKPRKNKKGRKQKTQTYQERIEERIKSL